MSENNELEAYLEQEVQATRKSFLFGSILFGILALVVFGYMAFLKGLLKSETQPRNLARAGVTQLRDVIPDAMKALESNAKTTMPTVVKMAIDSVILKGIPQVRNTAQGKLAGYARDVVDVAVSSGTDVFKEILRETKAGIKVPTDPGVDPADRTAFLKDLERNVQLKMTSKLDEKANDSAGLKLQQSAAALRRINDRLINLANAQDASGNDLKARSFITQAWSFLRQANMREGEDDKTPSLFHAGAEDSK